MIGLKHCQKCGYWHGGGRCCIDIYQQLGQTKGPSVIKVVLLAFALPLFIFIAALILVDYILSSFMTESGLRTFYAFAAAVGVTAVFVQLVRIFTRKPIDTENRKNHST